LGQYNRKIKKGIRYYYSGQYLGQKYFSKAIYLTKSECARAERQKLNELDEQARNPLKDIVLLDLMSDRLDQIKLKKSRKYFEENRRFFKMLLGRTGNIMVSQVTKSQVNKLLNDFSKDLKKRGKGNFKVNAMIRCLKAFFNYAIKVEDIDMKNPCVGIDLFPVEIKLKYIPPQSEILAVKEICTNEQNLLFDFVDQTACRIMEAVRFTVDDIDGDLITLRTRKSKNSNLTPRRIPKPPCLKNITGEDRVFWQWNSEPRFLGGKLKKLGLKGWSWHSLRHRRASIWASKGMETFEIMTRLGHSNLSTTMKYLQLLGFSRR